MYHPEKYAEHNEALERFIEEFNNSAITLGGEVQMYYQQNENFREDGGIKYVVDNRKILYDFEKRFSYYNCCGAFKFDTLGQFERKVAKKEIKLSIQCSKDEKCFLIAWHEDYYRAEQIRIGSITGSGSKEFDLKRFTKDFIELQYSQFNGFYKILLFAFTENKFNKESFSILNE